MLGVAALFHQIVRCLLGGADLHQPGLILNLMLAKVKAKAALTIMYHLHKKLL